MEIHSPNVIGALAVAGSDGVAGQVLTSAGPGVQTTWTTPTDNSFTFASASNVAHNIVHNLNTDYPVITVWDTDANEVVIPDSIVSLDSNTIEIGFAVARAIGGTIIR